MTHVIEIQVREMPSRHGTFQAKFYGRVVAQDSRTPVLDAARALIARGISPDAILQAMRGTTPSIRGRLSVLAGLTVREGYFAKYKPFSWHA